MPEFILTGPSGRIEARYHQALSPKAPIAIVLHQHPQFGGNMNNEVIYHLYYAFVKSGFTTLRFNFRGVGRSEGTFDYGQGELSDAATVLDTIQSMFPESKATWVAGFSFGSWIGMQLLMRRPEIEGFISVSPPANIYDFSFLAPCPSAGLVIHGGNDAVVPTEDVTDFVSKIKTQRDIVIEQRTVEGSNHLFHGKIPELIDHVTEYVQRRRAENDQKIMIPKLSADEQADDEAISDEDDQDTVDSLIDSIEQDIAKA